MFSTGFERTFNATSITEEICQYRYHKWGKTIKMDLTILYGEITFFVNKFENLKTTLISSFNLRCSL